jgi:hypothetical protein
MRRREFITLLGGAAAWPLAAGAQQMRRIAVVMSIEENDPEAHARVTSFRQGMQELGWVDGRNVRLDYRYVAGDVDRATRRGCASVRMLLAPGKLGKQDILANSRRTALAAQPDNLT